MTNGGSEASVAPPRTTRLRLPEGARGKIRTPESVIALLIALTALLATLFTWRASTLASQAGRADEQSLAATTARENAKVLAESELRQEMYFHALGLGEGVAGAKLASWATGGQLDPNEARALYTGSIEQGRLYEYIHSNLVPQGYLTHSDDRHSGLAELFKEAERRQALIDVTLTDSDVDPAVAARVADRRRAESLAHGRGFVGLAAVVVVLTVAECTRGRARRRLAWFGAGALVLTVGVTIV